MRPLFILFRSTTKTAFSSLSEMLITKSPCGRRQTLAPKIESLSHLSRLVQSDLLTVITGSPLQTADLADNLHDRADVFRSSYLYFTNQLMSGNNNSPLPNAIIWLFRIPLIQRQNYPFPQLSNGSNPMSHGVKCKNSLYADHQGCGILYFPTIDPSLQTRQLYCGRSGARRSNKEVTRTTLHSAAIAEKICGGPGMVHELTSPCLQPKNNAGASWITNVPLRWPFAIPHAFGYVVFRFGRRLWQSLFWVWHIRLIEFMTPLECTWWKYEHVVNDECRQWHGCRVET